MRQYPFKKAWKESEVASLDTVMELTHISVCANHMVAA